MKIRKFLLIVPTLLVMNGCASTTIIPVSANTVIVSTSAEADCGAQAALRIASRQAAAETIRRGFDKYMIVNSEGSSDIRQVGATPVFANTSASGNVVGNNLYVNSSTSVYGGMPIYGGSHDRNITIVMFHNGDEQGGNAIDAKSVLGPDWQKKIARPETTCLE